MGEECPKVLYSPKFRLQRISFTARDYSAQSFLYLYLLFYFRPSDYSFPVKNLDLNSSLISSYPTIPLSLISSPQVLLHFSDQLPSASVLGYNRETKLLTTWPIKGTSGTN